MNLRAMKKEAYKGTSTLQRGLYLEMYFTKGGSEKRGKEACHLRNEIELSQSKKAGSKTAMTSEVTKGIRKGKEKRVLKSQESSKRGEKGATKKEEPDGQKPRLTKENEKESDPQLLLGRSGKGGGGGEKKTLKS